MIRGEDLNPNGITIIINLTIEKTWLCSKKELIRWMQTIIRHQITLHLLSKKGRVNLRKVFHPKTTKSIILMSYHLRKLMDFSTSAWGGSLADKRKTMMMSSGSRQKWDTFKCNPVSWICQILPIMVYQLLSIQCNQIFIIISIVGPFSHYQ